MTDFVNPWQVIAERQAYDNPWIRVTEYDVINPSGGKGIYGKVHYKNVAVGIIALDADLNVYLVGQFRFVIDQYSWEIPEGGCPEGSDTLAAAQRELREETGLSAQDWRVVLRMHLSNSVSDEFAIVYLATGLTQGKADPEETEKLAVHKLPFHELYERVKKSEITDSMSVAAILKVKLMLFEKEIKNVRNFRQQHRPKKSSLIVGQQAILEAIGNGVQLERIYVQNSMKGPLIERIVSLAQQNLFPINYVPAAKLNGFNAANHDGAIALIAKVRYYDLQEIISFTVEQGLTPLFLILDGITDIRNIGGIARTAFCCGVHAIIIADKGTGALNEDAVATSAGALEHIPVCRVGSLMKAVDELHLNGIKVFASEMTAEKKIYDCGLDGPCAIVMGSEEKGIHAALMKICDERFKIPMTGNFESLNVSVATGMILYEAMRQRT